MVALKPLIMGHYPTRQRQRPSYVTSSASAHPASASSSSSSSFSQFNLSSITKRLASLKWVAATGLTLTGLYYYAQHSKAQAERKKGQSAIVVPSQYTPTAWDVRVLGYEESFDGYWCKRHLPELLKILPPQPQDRILDFGAGTGNVTLAVAPQCSMVMAYDASVGMLRKLESKLAQLPAEHRSKVSMRLPTQLQVMPEPAPEPNNAFLQTWNRVLAKLFPPKPLPPSVVDPFDKVYAHMSVVESGDPQHTVRGLYELTKRGGQVAVSFWASPSLNPLVNSQNWTMDTQPYVEPQQLRDVRSADWVPSDEEKHRIEETVNLFRSTGFTDVEVHYRRESMIPSEGGESGWSARWLIRKTVYQLMRMHTLNVDAMEVHKFRRHWKSHHKECRKKGLNNEFLFSTTMQVVTARKPQHQL